MTAHNHSTLVPGCFRCELGQDEARDAREQAESDFWLTAVSCETAAQLMARKIHKAVATDKPQQRADLIASALKQARRIVEGLEDLDA